MATVMTVPPNAARPWLSFLGQLFVLRRPNLFVIGTLVAGAFRRLRFLQLSALSVSCLGRVRMFMLYCLGFEVQLWWGLRHLGVLPAWEQAISTSRVGWVLVGWCWRFHKGAMQKCSVCCWRPYRVDRTGSLLTSEVKRHRARLVLGWGTAWEHPGVLPAFTSVSFTPSADA